MQNIVLDTNSLIMAISAKSAYNKVWQSFKINPFSFCLCNKHR